MFITLVLLGLLILFLVWTNLRRSSRSTDNLPIFNEEDYTQSQMIMQEFLESGSRTVFRSGRTEEELRQLLAQTLKEDLVDLPDELEVIPDSAVVVVPAQQYKGLYDGKITVRLRWKQSVA